MDTIVLKFGGSSVADNIRLNLVADKIIPLYEEGNNIVVVVSAQGKTTDHLLKEAHELSAVPEDRELDVLLSTGEQISMSKLSILLNRLGYPSISLTGWQAGIFTSGTYQNATVEAITTSRIVEELEKRKIVIIAGFQGINEQDDITTLGRGGSDTTALALASALEAKHCYIFSDVDGVYTTDPNKVTVAKKLETLSYTEMTDIAEEGAKVLHNRCVEIGEKYHIPIITKSTFNNLPGTVIQEKIEGTCVKSIVKNDDIIYVHAKSKQYSMELFYRIYGILVENALGMNHLVNNSTYTLDICFTIRVANFNKFTSLLDTELSMLECTYTNVSRVSIIGYGITSDSKVMKQFIEIIQNNQLEVLTMESTQSKISILFKETLPNSILEQLHHKMIQQ